MYMVLDTANNDGLAIEVVQNAAEVEVQFFAEILIAEKWSAFLGGKNGVNQNFGERLWHGREDAQYADWIQLFQS